MENPKKEFTLFDDAANDKIIPLNARELNYVKGKQFVFRAAKNLFIFYERKKAAFLFIEPVFRFLAYCYLLYKICS